MPVSAFKDLVKLVLEGTFPLFRRHHGFFNFWFAAFLVALAAFFPWPDHFFHTSKKRDIKELKPALPFVANL